jgi:hypothetical protein
MRQYLYFCTSKRIFWNKSTDTDLAIGGPQWLPEGSLLLLYWYKSPASICTFVPVKQVNCLTGFPKMPTSDLY